MTHGQFGTPSDDTVPVPAPTENRPGTGTTHSARPQPGEPVRTPPPAQHNPAPYSTPSSNPAPATQTPPTRPTRKPDPEEELDIPDFLK
ncbi:hypothetical protein [Kribbella sp. ALI-6-A]|uniref:hypothetical protein n=1 Tax=Kribbella sp. ALI-6-A TaxID=1933817 RepID=UPI003F8D1ECD